MWCPSRWLQSFLSNSTFYLLVLVGHRKSKNRKSCPRVVLFCRRFISSWWRNNGCITSSTWCRHHMETFSGVLALCAGNSPVTVEFPAKARDAGPWYFSLMCSWIKGWGNNCEACDLRDQRAHYDAIVMKSIPHIIDPRHAGLFPRNLNVIVCVSVSPKYWFTSWRS